MTHELQAEFDRETRKDALAFKAWRENGAHYESTPTARTDAERLACARRTVERRKAWRQTPEGKRNARLYQLLDVIEATGNHAAASLYWEIRDAIGRQNPAEKPLIDRLMGELEAMVSTNTGKAAA